MTRKSVGIVRELRVDPWRSSDVAFIRSGLLASASKQLGDDVPAVVPWVMPDTWRHDDGLDSSKIASVLGSMALAQLVNHRESAAVDRARAACYSHWLRMGSIAGQIQNAEIEAYVSEKSLEPLVENRTKKRTRASWISRLAEYAIERARWVVKANEDRARADHALHGKNKPAKHGYLNVQGVHGYSHGQSSGLGEVFAAVKSTVSESQDKTRNGEVVTTHPVRWETPGGWKDCDGRRPRSESSDRRSVLPTYPKLDASIDGLETALRAALEAKEATIAAARAPNTQALIDNAERILSLELKGHIATLMDCFAFPPFRGRVTAVYKEVGEFVRAGEPVYRIDSVEHPSDDRKEKFFAVGSIVQRNMIQVGRAFNLHVKDLYGTDTWEFPGVVRGIRGASAEDDIWDVVLELEAPKGKMSAGTVLVGPDAHIKFA